MKVFIFVSLFELLRPREVVIMIEDVARLWILYVNNGRRGGRGRCGRVEVGRWGGRIGGEGGGSAMMERWKRGEGWNDGEMEEEMWDNKEGRKRGERKEDSDDGTMEDGGGMERWKRGEG